MLSCLLENRGCEADYKYAVPDIVRGEPFDKIRTGLSNHEQYLGRLEHPLQLCPEQMLRATLFIIGSSALLRANGAILFSE